MYAQVYNIENSQVGQITPSYIDQVHFGTPPQEPIHCCRAEGYDSGGLPRRSDRTPRSHVFTWPPPSVSRPNPEKNGRLSRAPLCAVWITAVLPDCMCHSPNGWFWLALQVYSVVPVFQSCLAESALFIQAVAAFSGNRQWICHEEACDGLYLGTICTYVLEVQRSTAGVMRSLRSDDDAVAVASGETVALIHSGFYLWGTILDDQWSFNFRTWEYRWNVPHSWK